MLVLAVPAAAQMRADSTVADAWKLANGLEVRTLHVPHAPGVSITLAFRAGSGYDPAGREGLAELLAELQFTSAAGDVPERTREEMASLRPLGWESRPGTRLVRFTEIATRTQLAGVLQQVAKRLVAAIGKWWTPTSRTTSEAFPMPTCSSRLRVASPIGACFI